MKYFWLTNSIDTKVIGRYEQSESAHNAPEFWRDIERGKINDKMTVPEPIIHSKAILTSYLSSTPINSLSFLILKNDFIKFLESFEIGEFKIWDMNVHYKEKVVNDYCLFHLSYPSQEKYIDYGNSEFYTGNIKDYKWVGDAIEISGYENFLSTREILREQKLILKSKKLLFNFNEATEDLIRITNTPPIVGASGYFVSEKLKKVIEKEGFTGMAFQEIEEIDNRKRIKVIY